MKKFLPLFCLAFLCLDINAQCDSEIYLNSQADVDNFFDDYSDCLVPLGDELYALEDQSLIITGNDITNLYGLLMLQKSKTVRLNFMVIYKSIAPI